MRLSQVCQLTKRQLTLLKELNASRDYATFADIARALRMPRSTVSSALQVLDGWGLVRAVRTADSGRDIWKVQITLSGVGALAMRSEN